MRAKSEHNGRLKGTCYIKQVDGQQILFMPDGTRIPKTIFTRVHDEVHEIPTCLIKLFVELK